ncbi:head-tail connector protein [Marinobacter nauticus]|uniref:head-tail connector protein n=1 Tax=Marinobacter nauticus TaxID=2743 RepID=UPI000EAD10E2|nr:head-tail connector protein [Marinobacter nauticus]MBY6102304.1 head-tail connector protein [Marinobacter nauticus]MEC7815838.1 head-tail connector protein [Pseudomonadota bacterium]RKR79614.1 putative phage protein (predicted DNA packaging) [Marinobacter nauticus]
MLELDIIKPHLRLELDDSEEDALLETYATAAQRYVENHIGRNLYATAGEIPKDPETGEPTDDHALVLDDDITAAMLLLIGHWYVNRESVVVGSITAEVPMAVDALICPYRHFYFA